ncbi:hypothetical protein SAMN05216474_2440 [Lishizhenia tianjinensis]|uniref:Uncharacterized protein n=1 Tax=Lishizhenia tianjinensis TaxID=477690 RepID=A0A1I7B0N1_9FLAO|nr:hypothetical protein [Lishizhenia tianjinensis]SFT80709.1 hypothetical protein SAMN05216474_2440 [Lishizhenia tianjinensis]
MTFTRLYLLLILGVFLTSCRKNTSFISEEGFDSSTLNDVQHVYFHTQDSVYYNHVPQLSCLLSDEENLYIGFTDNGTFDDPYFGFSVMSKSEELSYPELPWGLHTFRRYRINGIKEVGDDIYVYGDIKTNDGAKKNNAFKYNKTLQKFENILCDVDFGNNTDKHIRDVEVYQGNVLGIFEGNGYFCLNNILPNAVNLYSFGDSYRNYTIINDTVYKISDIYNSMIANPTATTNSDQAIFTNVYDIYEMIDFKGETWALGNFYGLPSVLGKANWSNESFERRPFENDSLVRKITNIITTKIINDELYLSGAFEHKLTGNSYKTETCLIKFDGEKFSLVFSGKQIQDLEIFNGYYYYFEKWDNNLKKVKYQ